MVVRRGFAGLVCCWLVVQPLVAGAPPAKQPAEIQGEARTLHMLDRFTFGPRPGDVAAADRLGAEAWFERQLNPAAIDDAAFETRLQAYPAMRLSVAELEDRYPNPGRLRQMAAGRLDLPTDPVRHAMVEDQIAFYQIQRAKREKVAAGAAALDQNGKAETPAMTPETTAAANTPMQPPPPAQPHAASARTLDQALGMAGDEGMEKPIPASEIAPETGMDAAAAALPHEQVERVLSLPPEQRMQAILQMSPQDLVRLRQGLKPRELARLVEGLTPEQKETLVALPGSLRMVALEAMESRVLRDVYSERQVEAVMTDFWLNHFNVYVRKNQQEPYLIPTYERETIRAHALGSFEDLLVATAESPAMQVYLDNYRSVGPDSAAAKRVEQAKQAGRPLAKQASAGLNENYGRELMELHTLGVGGGYTQADVTSVAEVFTGWGVDRQTGQFEFNERRHEPGSKTVLGKTIREGGQQEGLTVLHLLATSPATAHFISEKLAERFVSDTPPPALVDRMAKSFLASNGDIKTVLRTLFNAPEFWSPQANRAKVKTPEEFVFSAVRASGTEVQNPQALVQSLDKLGMPLYGMQTPNGYSWKQDGWISTGALVSRMNFALVLSGGRLPGTRPTWTSPGRATLPVAFSPDSAAEQKESALETMLLGRPASSKTRATVLAQSSDTTVTEQAATQFDLRGTGKSDVAGRGIARIPAGGTPQDARTAVMAGLLLGSPEFQRR